MAIPLSPSFPLHLLVTLSSLSCVCMAGFYVHPLLLPLIISLVPCLGSAMRALLAPPILFILLNLLVMAFFVTSSVTPQGKRKQENGAVISSSESEYPTDDGADDGSNVAFSVDDGLGADEVAKYVFLHPSPCDNFITDAAASINEVSNDHVLLHDSAGENLITDVADDMKTRNSQPEILSCKSPKNRARLVRSKSDGNILLQGAERTPSQLRPVRLLRKTGSSESTWRRRRVKQVVVVEDPSDEGQVAEEEVDKKAEEFIGRFYQRMKLQR